jgi:TonB family protein
VVSRARPPRPKFDYTRQRLIGASRFAGHTIKVMLVVDPRGHVREVQLLEGVDRDLDRRTVALVQRWEFEPALDDEGVATRGTQRWDIQIVEDEDDSPFKTGLQRHL